MEVMARYGGGAVGYGTAADVAWKVGRIMLKYRPIAPKPVSGGAVAAGPAETKSSSGRGKRKGCMKEGRSGRKRAKKIAAAVEAGAFGEEQEKNKSSNNFSAAPSVITLPLMPVTPERKEESSATPTPLPTVPDGHVSVCCLGRPAWQQVGTTTASSNSSSNNYCNISSPSSSSVVVAPRPVSSCVTVECVTGMWREGDVQVAPLFVSDTCPVFVSDACNRVTWTNAAYKRMVAGHNEEEDEEEEEEEEEEEVMRVALVTKGMVPAGPTCFTCGVRVRYACKRKGGKVSMAAPCDVWRLADGRLAWRLDVKAALSLSLGS